MSRHVLLGIVVWLAIAGCNGDRSTGSQINVLPSTTSLPAPTLVYSDAPVIFLYDQCAGVRDGTEPPALEVAAWADGRIVWRAAGSLLQSRVDTKRIDELIQRLHADGVFGNGNVECMHVGPDAAYQVVEIGLTDRKLVLASWHELAEQAPGVVASSFGIEPLNGRTREFVLAVDSPAYRRFRHVWADVRTTVKSWTPPTGTPFTGDVPLGR